MTATDTPSWKTLFHKGFAPVISTEGLVALEKALASDDVRLLQGATTQPPPLQCVQEWPVEAACAIGYCGWQGDGLEKVNEVEEYFARVCGEVDQRMHEPAACRWLLNAYDEWPRDEMIRNLLPEVRLALALREMKNDPGDSD